MTNQVSAVTNTIIAEQHSAIWEFMSQHTSEIIVSILTAAILSISAILWNYFGHPTLSSFLRKRADRRRRDELVTAFSKPEVSAGTHCIRNKEFVQIALHNKTPKPVVVRRVTLVREGRAVYGCWHNPQQMDQRDYTETVTTGVQIAPQGFGVWHYTGPEFTSAECPCVDSCEIEFEYSSDGTEVSSHTMRTTEAMAETIQKMFGFWWQSVQRKHKKEEPQPECYNLQPGDKKQTD